MQLKASTRDPQLLVDILRRLKGVQEGVVRGQWIIHAWYKRRGEKVWTADADNDGRLRRYVLEVPKLLRELRGCGSEFRVY